MTLVQNHFRSEEKLLIACARAQLSPNQSEQIQLLLKQEINWSYFFKIASDHKLIPLVHYHLNSSSFQKKIPISISAKLHKHYGLSSQRAIRMAGELIKVSSLFSEQNIFAVSYKGPTLALLLYGHVNLRRFADLDILVHKRDAIKVKNLLESQGYQAGPNITDQQWEYIFHYHDETTFSKNGIYIDLHWQVPLENESLEEKTQVIYLGNHKFHTFTKENLLLILSSHGAKHAWNRLNWICDITEMIHKYPQMNWSWIFQKSEATTQKRRVLLALSLSESIFKTPIPNEAVKLIEKDPSIKKLVCKVRKNLFKKQHAFSWIFDVTFYFSTLEKYRDKLELLLKHVTPKYIVRLVRFIYRKIFPFPKIKT